MNKFAPTTLHIVANTRATTEAFGRRNEEIVKLVSGIGRQNTELKLKVSHASGTRLTLLQVDPGLQAKVSDGKITRHSISLMNTIGTANPLDVFDRSKSIDELRSGFAPMIKHMEKIVKDADVVFLSGTYYFPWALLQAARNQNKPVVICYAGILSMEISHLPEDIQTIMRVMEKDFDQPSLHYVFPSDLTRKTVEGIFGHPLSKSEIIFNGVPLEFFEAPAHSKKDIGVAFVGRFTSVKNPKFMIDLANELTKRGSKSKVHMVTKSVPDYPLFHELEASPVVIHSPMETKDLARFYSSTSVVLSPSHFETYGNVPLEAVSAGTPALISPFMGVTEVFNQLDLSHWITKFDDAQTIADKVEGFVKNKVSISPEIRTRIRNMLSWQGVAGKYLDICTSHAQTAFSKWNQAPEST